MGGRVSHLPYRLCILHPPVVRRFELSFPLHRNVPAYTSFVTLLHSLLFIQAGGRNLLVCIVQYLFAVVRSMYVSFVVWIITILLLLFYM